MTRLRQTALLARREARTVARAPGYAGLCVAAAAVALGVVVVTGASRFVPAVLDLLAPVELLVSAGAVALGHRVFLADRRSGEASLRATFPVTPRTVAVGVFLGRAVALAAGVLLALAPAGVFVALTGPDSGLVATHRGADSPLLYLRFVALATMFGLSVLAASLGVSALASRGRRAVALALATWLLLAVGVDVALVAGVGRGALDPGTLASLLAASPTGAFRGLVLETVADVAASGTLDAAARWPSLVGLAGWVLAGLWVTIRGLRATSH
jgi:ABC-2 type transport system permease protein